MVTRSCGVALMLTVLSTAVAADQPRPLAVDNALGQLSFASRVPIDVSPDGQWVAYTLQDPRRRESAGQLRFSLFTRTGATAEAEACDVWITRIATGESRNLTKGQGTSWGPAWSPDSRALAFYSDRGGQAKLWIWNAVTDQSRPVSEAAVRPLFGFEVPQWTRDGTRILTKVLPAHLTFDAAVDLLGGARPGSTPHDAKDGVTAVVYRSPSTLGLAKPGGEPTAWMDASLADLALIEVQTGAVDRIVKGDRPRGYWISPDGASVAYTTYKGDESEETQQALFDLNIGTLEDGSARVVGAGLHSVRHHGELVAGWDAIGVSDRGAKGQRDCFLIHASGGKPVKLTNGTHPDFSHSYSPPLWDPEGRSIYLLGEGDLWKLNVANRTFTRITQGGGPPIKDVLAAGHGRLWSPDAGGSAIVATRDHATKRVGYERIDLHSGQRTRLLDEDKHYDSAVFSTRVTRDGTRIIYLAQDARHGTDLWSAAPDFHDARWISRINPLFDDYTFGKSCLVHRAGSTASLCAAHCSCRPTTARIGAIRWSSWSTAADHCPTMSICSASLARASKTFSYWPRGASPSWVSMHLFSQEA